MLSCRHRYKEFRQTLSANQIQEINENKHIQNIQTKLEMCNKTHNTKKQQYEQE